MVKGPGIWIEKVQCKENISYQKATKGYCGVNMEVCLNTPRIRLQFKLTEACERSMVSKMRLMTLDIWMTSPLIRQSFLLSSSTVFMFSIHTASIGPSKITHLRSGVSVDANSRKVLAVTPSDH